MLVDHKRILFVFQKWIKLSKLIKERLKHCIVLLNINNSLQLEWSNEWASIRIINLCQVVDFNIQSVHRESLRARFLNFSKLYLKRRESFKYIARCLIALHIRIHSFHVSKPAHYCSGRVCWHSIDLLHIHVFVKEFELLHVSISHVSSVEESLSLPRGCQIWGVSVPRNIPESIHHEAFGDS